jgi:hypothetical protein
MPTALRYRWEPCPGCRRSLVQVAYRQEYDEEPAGRCVPKTEAPVPTSELLIRAFGCQNPNCEWHDPRHRTN